MNTKQRLDLWLVANGLVESREKAQALIMAGEVTVNGQRAGKPSLPVAQGSSVVLTAKPRYVSRGGVKLEAALKEFCIDATRVICADFGTSTGGFTDCLLQAGATRVHAIDTGAGQIDWRLRSDSRVILHENTNARFLEPATIGEKIGLAVCDVSFISATLILPVMSSILQPQGQIVVLVKPQFEVGKGHVGKGGIVRDPQLHRAACEKVRSAAEALGFMTRIVPSPIDGAEGNKEFLLHGRR